VTSRLGTGNSLTFFYSDASDLECNYSCPSGCPLSHAQTPSGPAKEAITAVIPASETGELLSAVLITAVFPAVGAGELLEV
jgi:hypothetical protein